MDQQQEIIMELKVGRVYRAKKPRPAGSVIASYFNDRQILWMDEETVQYDGPAVANGRRYPKVSREEFVKWAARDVTDQMPKDDWGRWGSSE